MKTGLDRKAAYTPLRVHRLDHLVLRVRDPEAALDWYVRTFGFKPLRVAEYRAGTVPFPSVEIEPGCIIDLDARGTRTGENLAHFCLVVEETDLVGLAASGTFDVIDGPHRRWGARGPADLVYIRDPDGNTIELRHYGPSQLVAD
ncbi:VOC family protein [Streptomyces shenzhenensis]|uniref:VOC family protein n=1 Tax=Streptomyces shenzhenensis TaxID=943815 RepID=UPI00381BA036